MSGKSPILDTFLEMSENSDKMSTFGHPVAFLRGFNGMVFDTFCIFLDYCESLDRTFYTFVRNVRNVSKIDTF